MQGPSCLSQTHGTLLIPPSCPHRAQERDSLLQVRLQHHTTRLFVGHSLVVGGMAPCTCNLCKQVVHTHIHPHTHIPTDTHSYTQYGNKPYAKCTRDHMHIHTHQMQLMPTSRSPNVLVVSPRQLVSRVCILSNLSSYIAGRRYPNNISLQSRLNYTCGFSGPLSISAAEKLQLLGAWEAKGPVPKEAFHTAGTHGQTWTGEEKHLSEFSSFSFFSS